VEKVSSLLSEPGVIVNMMTSPKSNLHLSMTLSFPSCTAPGLNEYVTGYGKTDHSRQTLNLRY